MSTRHLFRWLSPALAILFLTVAYFPDRAATQPQGAAPSTEVQTAGGLTVVTFVVNSGKIKVNLPDDMRAGDTISGTVVTEPKGNTKEERGANQSELGNLGVRIKFSDLPDEKPKEVSCGDVAVPFTGAYLNDEKVNELVIELFKKLGEALAQATIPVPTHPSGAVITPDPKITMPKHPSGAVITPDPRTTTNPPYYIPPLGQPGRPMVITGPFDGDSSNTTLHFNRDFEKNTESVSGGLGPLAESPRKAVFRSPTNFTGPVELNLKEGNVETKGTYRNVGVNLRAPKTNLLKGEKTTLTVEVTGLEGIKQRVPLTLTYEGVINMEGGNFQPLSIQPSQVSADGRYTTTRGITGVQTGVWGATATVVTQLPTGIYASPGPSASQGTPQTTGGNQPPTATTPQPSSTPATIPVGTSAADLKKQCEDLQRQLNEAKGPCEKKEKECAELERKLAELAAAAKTAQQDYDQKKQEFDQGMQNLLNSIIAAAKAKKYEVKLSLTKPEDKKGEKWVALKLADGVVIYFDAGGIEHQVHIDNLARALRALASGRAVSQLKQQATALAGADAKNKAAQAALAAAQQAYDKCKAELDALCPKVKKLQEELEKCRRDAETAAREEERRKAEQQEKDKAAEALRIEQEKQRQTDQKRKAAAEKEAADRAAAEAARQLDRLKRQRLCTDCLRFLLQQSVEGAKLSDQSRLALQALSNALDKLNDVVDKAGKASDILPGSLKEQLEKVAEALGKISELRDLANQLTGIIDKLNKLAAGGNDPTQFATLLQLTADVLGAVAARIPILGPLAEYFKLLADAGDAIINGLPNAIGAEAARKWGSMIDVWNCHAYASFLQTYNGDLNRIYEKVFPAAERGIIAKVPRAEEKLKQALLAKLKKCCIEWITKECSKRD